MERATGREVGSVAAFLGELAPGANALREVLDRSGAELFSKRGRGDTSELFLVPRSASSRLGHLLELKEAAAAGTFVGVVREVRGGRGGAKQAQRLELVPTPAFVDLCYRALAGRGAFVVRLAPRQARAASYLRDVSLRREQVAELPGAQSGNVPALVLMAEQDGEPAGLAKLVTRRDGAGRPVVVAKVVAGPGSYLKEDDQAVPL
ncbi:MAG: hypothetical protein Kow0069_27890 [Promethearchaeota archaeon]